MLGEYDKAIEHFTTAITKEPENLEYLQNRADCYFDRCELVKFDKDGNQVMFYD